MEYHQPILCLGRLLILVVDLYLFAEFNDVSLFLCRIMFHYKKSMTKSWSGLTCLLMYGLSSFSVRSFLRFGILWMDARTHYRFSLAYEPHLDQVGHKAGPNSDLVNVSQSVYSHSCSRFIHRGLKKKKT
jgi:predicted AlkP superfamily pyrophosphatase or phosphodiesterase